MKQSFWKIQIVAILALATFLYQCSTQATIRTEPSNIEIYQDGELLGITPLEHSFSNLIFNKNEIELRKNDRVIRTTNLTKEGKFWTTVGCYLIYIPCLWIAGPAKDQLFILEKHELKKAE